MDDLLAVVERDLADCTAERLSDDWKFGIAYNAALQLATAALHASGYRPARGQSHHIRAIESLAFTLGLGAATVNQLDAFRAKRHAHVYDRAGAVSAGEAQEMIELAHKLDQDVRAWLKRTYPKLFPA